MGFHVKSEIMDAISGYDVTLVPDMESQNWFVLDANRAHLLVITDNGSGSYMIVEPGRSFRLRVTYATINTLSSSIKFALNGFVGLERV